MRNTAAVAGGGVWELGDGGGIGAGTARHVGTGHSPAARDRGGRGAAYRTVPTQLRRSRACLTETTALVWNRQAGARCFLLCRLLFSTTQPPGGCPLCHRDGGGHGDRRERGVLPAARQLRQRVGRCDALVAGTAAHDSHCRSRGTEHDDYHSGRRRILVAGGYPARAITGPHRRATALC